MFDDLNCKTKLNNGVEMNWIGLGVFRVEEGNDVYDAVRCALDAGYRSIDTAAVYKNEEGVGRAIADSGIARKELFITTKVWNEDQRNGNIEAAFETSLKKLGLDYVDLYLVHWPVKEKYVATWKELEKLYQNKRTRAIGVSNFNIHHLEDIFNASDIVPAVNQVECHPYLSQKELLNFCKSNNIQLEAWAPLVGGKINIHEDPVIQEIAKKYGKTTAQVILRWDIQCGIVTIPKSTNKGRIAENISIFDFALAEEDMKKIDGLNMDKRFGSDPETFTF